MARIKSEAHKYITIREEEYLVLIENTMMIEALKIAGIEKLPIYKSMRRIIDDRRVEIHIKPIGRRYSD